MLSQLFDVAEIREMRDLIGRASKEELAVMRAQLGEVMGLIDQMGMVRDSGRVSVQAPIEVSVVTSTKPKSKGGTVRRKCDNQGCTVVYEARHADLKRGWGRCCSKSCAASHKLRCNPSHGYLHGGAERSRMSEDEIRERDHQAAMSDCELGWDGHKGAF